jgi:2'-5' RNA ligase
MKYKPSQKELPLMQMAGYRQNEYRLILSPHEALREKISQARQEFNEKFKAPGARLGKPYITLARFVQLEMMEERILNRLKVVAMGFYPIKVELKDFGSLPTHSIFIQIPTKEPIRQLVRQIKTWQRLLKLNDNQKPYFPDELNMTIARQLQPEQFEAAWKEYVQKSFSGRFIADSMLLLKKPHQHHDQPI